MVLRRNNAGPRRAELLHQDLAGDEVGWTTKSMAGLTRVNNGPSARIPLKGGRGCMVQGGLVGGLGPASREKGKQALSGPCQTLGCEYGVQSTRQLLVLHTDYRVPRI